MRSRRIWIGLLVLVAVLGAATSASAGNYVIYLHGRSMSSWPSTALLGATAQWSHVRMSYNGSATLGDGAIQGSINDTIAGYCGGGNQCVVMCYSAGCARMLLAFRQLKDQQRYPAGILWSSAAGSAAGGSELAVLQTKWWARLLARLFGGERDAPIDYDIQPNGMRYGAYASVQNQATVPVYHLAGSRNMCQTFSIFGLIKIKLCGNGRFPGSYGDGVVPVHSAGGYADTGAHSNHQDGGAKYLFRAYEQTELYPVDHFGVTGPLVSTASLRLAVGQNVNCPNMPDFNLDLPDASIIYDDGDAAFAREASPLSLLAMCGDHIWNGEPPLYSTCLSSGGLACCTAFSNGNAGGCSCGETLCKQAQRSGRSYYTGTNCTGDEYSDAPNYGDYVSYDGLGMVGEVRGSVVVRSVRESPTGRCQRLVQLMSLNCPDEGTQTTATLGSARRVYRPSGAPPPPSGTGPDIVVRYVKVYFPCRYE